MTSTVKYCSKCNTETERYKSGKCKACVKAYNSKWYPANTEYHAVWRAENPDKVKAAGATYREANRDKRNAYNEAWRAANPGKVKSLTKAWYEKNRDKQKTQHAAWIAENKEKIKLSHAAWISANLEKCRVYNSNRRAKTSTEGKLSPNIKEKLFRLQKGKCPCCGNSLGDDYHIDHIIPLALGGSNTDDNIQLLRSKCNLQKHAKHPIDFMQQRGFLL